MKEKILSFIMFLSLCGSHSFNSSYDYLPVEVILDSKKDYLSDLPLPGYIDSDSESESDSNTPKTSKLINAREIGPYYYDPSKSNSVRGKKGQVPEDFKAPEVVFISSNIKRVSKNPILLPSENENNIVNSFLGNGRVNIGNENYISFTIPKQMIPEISKDVKVNLELNSLEPIYLLARDIYSKQILSKKDPGRTLHADKIEFDQDNILKISFKKEQENKPYEIKVETIGCIKTERIFTDDRESIVEDPIEALSTMLFLIENKLNTFESGYEFIFPASITMQALKANFTETLEKIAEFVDRNPNVLDNKLMLIYSDRGTKRYSYGVSLFLRSLAPRFFEKYRDLFLLRDDADFRSRGLAKNALDITTDMLTNAIKNDQKAAELIKKYPEIKKRTNKYLLRHY